jgi:16S rRNA (cytidine1402-2'-O)-methyltransferase
MAATIYLIPSQLDDQGFHVLPAYLLDAIKDCEVFFVENERTARRYLKQLWREMVIDEYEWHGIHKAEDAVVNEFRQKVKEGKRIGIISEAGCPGVADPGQRLVQAAQELQATVRPLVGPSSILLALMASGMNGQQFHFHGYLPIDNAQRIKVVRELESNSARQQCTQLFIETPYRNNAMLDTLIKQCKPDTRICVAVDLTGPKEWVRTRTVKQWQHDVPDLHKRPAIFLLQA